MKELPPLTIRQVRRTEADGLYNGLIERFHYLGYAQPVGEHLKHIVSLSRKDVLGYPLAKDFREKLCGGHAP